MIRNAVRELLKLDMEMDMEMAYILNVDQLDRTDQVAEVVIIKTMEEQA